ncbi:MAG: aspartate dehydrogenase [Lachnospiraceae bacterium]|nr:aspartate dehydrogenase [Lachnospiraceae bacterium]
MFSLFKKKTTIETESYDPQKVKPVLKCSICNGEQVAGFLDLHTKAFEEVMFVRDHNDLAEFKRRYGIIEEIDKIY